MSGKPSAQGSGSLQNGLIVANYGRHYLVETPSRERVICHSRGKRSQAVVGDRVQWLASLDSGTIERIATRRNLLSRQDDTRTKTFAANLDLVLILIAPEPEFSSRQLARALIAAHEQGITPLIVLNKRDLQPAFEGAWQRLQPYRAMGYEVLALSAKHDGRSEIDALRARLQGLTALILGPSGSGKSTLINKLIPDANAQTGALSKAMSSGRHTTTSTTWYWVDLDPETALIDSPGFQEFGLHHIDPAQLPAFMPDIGSHATECRFYNCTHLHEPACAVRAAVNAESEQGINPQRYEIYADLFEELAQARRAI